MKPPGFTSLPSCCCRYSPTLLLILLLAVSLDSMEVVCVRSPSDLVLSPHSGRLAHTSSEVKLAYPQLHLCQRLHHSPTDKLHIESQHRLDHLHRALLTIILSHHLLNRSQPCSRTYMHFLTGCDFISLMMASMTASLDVPVNCLFR